jgi:opacity protein-like surface antigen
MKRMAFLALTLIGATAYSETCASNFSGFYAGLQAGINSSTGSVKINDYAASYISENTSNFSGTAGNKSFVGGLFGGYGLGIGSCAYVGFEAYINFSNDNNKLYDTTDYAKEDKTFKITAKQNLSGGAKIRLGYTITPQTMVFLGLGLEYSKWQLKSENLQTLYPQNGIETATKKNRSLASFAPSVGLETFLTKNLFVRGEYTYVVGSKQKLNPQQVYDQGGAGAAVKITTNVKVNLDQQRFTLGLGYKF